MIVIDSYSTDRTVEIVKQSGAILLQREFDDFIQTYADNTDPKLMNNKYAQFLHFDNFIRKKVKEL